MQTSFVDGFHNENANSNQTQNNFVAKNILIIGKRRSGKTSKILELYAKVQNNVDEVIVFDETHKYSNSFNMNDQVITNLKDFKKMMKYVKEKAYEEEKEKKFKNRCLIVDNMDTFDIKTKNEFKKILMISRHIKLQVITACQHISALDAVTIRQFDEIYLGMNENNVQTLKKMRDYFETWNDIDRIEGYDVFNYWKNEISPKPTLPIPNDDFSEKYEFVLERLNKILEESVCLKQMIVDLRDDIKSANKD